MAPTEVTVENVKGMAFNGVAGKNYGSTYAGGQWNVAHTNRFIQAVSKPEDYLAGRVKAIEGVNEKLDKEFCERYAKWLSQGVTRADALSRTENYITKLSEALMDELNLMWPENITETAANISYNKSKLGKNGVDPAAGAVRGRKGK